MRRRPVISPRNIARAAMLAHHHCFARRLRWAYQCRVLLGLDGDYCPSGFATARYGAVAASIDMALLALCYSTGVAVFAGANASLARWRARHRGVIRCGIYFTAAGYRFEPRLRSAIGEPAVFTTIMAAQRRQCRQPPMASRNRRATRGCGQKLLALPRASGGGAATS